MSNANFERIFPATLEESIRIIDFIVSVFQSLGLESRRVMELRLAVEEAVVNICTYAYPDSPGEITVHLQPGEGQITLELKDTGIPFDPLQQKTPNLTLPGEERPIGGLGIFLMRQIADEIHYRRENQCNILTMIVQKESRAGVL